MINDETKNTSKQRVTRGMQERITIFLSRGVFFLFKGGATKRCHTAVVYKRGILKEPYLVGGFNSSEKYQPIWIMFPGKGENKKRRGPPPRTQIYTRVKVEDTVTMYWSM